MVSRIINIVLLYLKLADNTGKKTLFTTDGVEHALTGMSMYFMRSTLKKALNEETYQVFNKNYKIDKKSLINYYSTLEGNFGWPSECLPNGKLTLAT